MQSLDTDMPVFTLVGGQELFLASAAKPAVQAESGRGIGYLQGQVVAGGLNQSARGGQLRG